MSASDRSDAQAHVQQAFAELARIPHGRISTEVLAAHSTKALALAGVGAVYALLDIADAIRSHRGPNGR